MSAHDGRRACGWLAPLLPALTAVTGADVASLERFEDDLESLLATYPVGGDVERSLRSDRLRQIRTATAASGHLVLAVPSCYGGSGRPAAVQALMQFVCGYHDVDLRDSTGLGHGRLIAEHAPAHVRDLWILRLLGGAVPGIAITESHGGSQARAARTCATLARDGTWTVTGVKTWISRLTEAAVFCLFFTDPGGDISVAAVDARSEGLTRVPFVPAGLSGWTWGELHFDKVRIDPNDVIGRPGTGMRLLREHFAGYRPLVAATALGAAAGCHDRTVAALEARRRSGDIVGLRDNALITIGRSYAEINAALLAACASVTLAETGSPLAVRWGCAVKAYGVDAAYRAVSELALLAGAGGFVAGCATAKAARDLNALLYADGIHDSLYRAAGRALTGLTPEAVRVPPSRTASLAGT
ncbi:MAG TPA: acyl-CoA dehydrogenase family protein [Trebonia sp.]|nr:acyl-CoA dehydrogenase family protein [Trebonia sp.]